MQKIVLSENSKMGHEMLWRRLECVGFRVPKGVGRAQGVIIP